VTARAARAVAAAGLLALGAVALAHETTEELGCTVEASGEGHLLATLDLSPAFAPDFAQKARNGLNNVVVIFVEVAPSDGGEPPALYSREVDILFDVWDEVYNVTEKDFDHPRGQRRVFKDYASLYAFITDARGLDLVPLSELGAGPYELRTRVAVNPVSKEMLERTREFIANPGVARGPGMGGSRSVLGAMASYLLKDAEAGAEAHTFRSRPFKPREVSRRAAAP
jgi:hypothetical protein